MTSPHSLPQPSQDTVMNDKRTELVTRNELAGFTQFVTADVPYLVETRHAGVDILRDLEARQVIGYRVYDLREGWERAGDDKPTLTAAAPDLLAALKELGVAMKGVEFAAGHPIWAAAAKARAAIAAAEGTKS